MGIIPDFSFFFLVQLHPWPFTRLRPCHDRGGLKPTVYADLLMGAGWISTFPFFFFR